jgi:putative DNA primase/helicase
MTYLDPRAIVNAMGGVITGRDTCNVPGSGHSEKDRSLSIKTGPHLPGGFIICSHADDCDPLGLKDYVRSRLGLGQWKPGDKPRALTPAEKANLAAAQAREKEERKRYPLQIWNGCQDPRGTIVEKYLNQHRCIDLGDDVAGTVVRYHPALKMDGAYRPAMVCLYRDIATNEPCGIHRTFLDHGTAQKIDRRMMGPVAGAAIKFDLCPVGGSLVIGEGVETVLSARILGLRPAWALGSSGAVGRFPLIKELSVLRVLEEDDATSRGDVETVGRRYYQANLAVRVIRPRNGRDMNDELRARK